jgi:hypothetical protein
MNLRVAILSFVVLGIGITIYPPFRWNILSPSDEEQSNRLRYYLFKEHEFPGKDLQIAQMSVRNTHHEWLWGVEQREFDIEWGWNEWSRRSILTKLTVSRQLNRERFALYFVLAAMISLLFGALTYRMNLRSRRDNPA